MAHDQFPDALQEPQAPEPGKYVYYTDAGNPFAPPIELYDLGEDEPLAEAVSEPVVVEPDAHGANLLTAIQRSAAADQTPITGTAERAQPQLSIDEHGIAHVAMNRSGYVLLDIGEHGHIATSGFAGCVGAIGFVANADGTTRQFASHYGPYAQSVEKTGKDSPINDHMRTFDSQTAAHAPGTEPGAAQYVVTYHTSALKDLDYGQRQGEFKQWHPLDQIQATAEGLSPQSSTLFLPYGVGIHTLAAGRDAAGEGIYWNGMSIDPNNAESVAAIPGAFVVHGSGQRA